MSEYDGDEKCRKGKCRRARCRAARGCRESAQRVLAARLRRCQRRLKAQARG